MSDTGPALLRVENLSKHFGGLIAVDDVTMSFLPNKLHSIIGPNGAGKTTYFNLLTGMFPPSGGKIFFKDQEITNLGPDETFRRRMVRTFQITSIFPKLSVLKNVEIAAQGRYRSSNSPLSRLTKKRRDIRKLCLERLEQFKLHHHASQRAGLLAYGDKRRLEIVMGLVSEPEMLLLDEPTAGMSPEETSEAVHIIRDISSTVTVLLVEHDMRLIMDLSDRITVMHQGAVLADGRPDEIMSDPKVQAVYLGQESCAPGSGKAL